MPFKSVVRDVFAADGAAAAAARSEEEEFPMHGRRTLRWTRETSNFQVFEEDCTPTKTGTLYLPNDILRVGRAFGEIEIITSTRRKHICNCPHCERRDA